MSPAKLEVSDTSVGHCAWKILGEHPHSPISQRTADRSARNVDGSMCRFFATLRGTKKIKLERNGTTWAGVTEILRQPLDEAMISNDFHASGLLPVLGFDRRPL